jgi:hypothetical protein
LFKKIFFMALSWRENVTFNEMIKPDRSSPALFCTKFENRRNCDIFPGEFGLFLFHMFDSLLSPLSTSTYRFNQTQREVSNDFISRG